MRKLSWLVTGAILILCVALISCGYAKKDMIEKQIADQKIELEQKIQLAQDSATMASDKADKNMATVRVEIEKARMDAISAAEEKDLQTLEKAKSMIEAGDAALKLAISENSAKTLADATSLAMAEDEKVKDAAKKAADKALSAAEEADRKAMQAAKEAELAKQLPKFKESSVFTVYFDLGATKLKKEGIDELKKAAEVIQAHSGAMIRIEGHTDNTPVVRAKHMNNWGLSQARAQSVKDYLIKTLGISEDSISEVTGFAYYKPAAPNSTNKGRQMNRRVDVVIVPKE